VVFGLFIPVTAQAEPVTDARIEKLEAAVEALQAELATLKAEKAKESASAIDKNQIKLMFDKTFEEKKGELGTVPDWVKNIKLSGDFRYRHESIDAQSSGKD